MAEDEATLRGSSNVEHNGEHAPKPKRRKHIYPPPTKPSAIAENGAPTSARPLDARAEVVPEPKPKRRKHIYPPPTPSIAASGAADDTSSAAVDASGEHTNGSLVGTEHLRSRAIGRIDGADVSVQLGAIGATRAERVSVDRGALGAAMADRVDVSRGYARSILARNVQLDRAAARVVIAADVTTRQSAVMFLIARRVSGDVRVLFDWRGALAFGAVAGIIAGLIARARRPRG